MALNTINKERAKLLWISYNSSFNLKYINYISRLVKYFPNVVINYQLICDL